MKAETPERRKRSGKHGRGACWMGPICITSVSMAGLVNEKETFLIRAACFEVYREKGCGFLEAVYEECLQIELRLQGVPFTRQQAIHLEYKSNPLKCSYVPDFVCFEGIILEVKAVSALSDEHRAQVQNYLRATGYEVGMLANFGHFPKMQIERFVGGKGRYRTSPSFRGPSGEAGL
jgi:GxxExxY protein